MTSDPIMRAIWTELSKERKARKWTNWSAHFAWSIALVAVPAYRLDLGWALLLSMFMGIAWELGGTLLGGDWKARVLDLISWELGALLTAAALVWLKP